MTKFLKKEDVEGITGYCSTHFMRLADKGKFPKPVKCGLEKNSAVRFVAEEIEAWMAARMAAREQVDA